MLRACLLVSAAAITLSAQTSPWIDKRPQAWSPEDTRRLLADSPWAKTVRAAISPLQTEDQRREGGNMGQEHGLGYDGLADDRPRIQAPRSLLDIAKPEAPVQQPHRSIALQLRWESALPIRLAQLKSAGPAFETADAYTLAVYGIPRVHAYIAPNSLSASLASQAVLRRGAKPAVRPSRVEVIQRDDDTAVLYYFPLAAEISRNDRRVTFEAQIGRIAIVQFFTLEEMLFQGKLEL